MKVKTLALTLLSGIILSSPVWCSDFRTAVRLYDAGLYPEAFEIFVSLSETSSDAMNEGYKVLCMEKMKSEDCNEAVVEYRKEFGVTPLSSEVYFQHGLNLFDNQYYNVAAASFAEVNESSLSRLERIELLYKSAYCNFALNDFEAASRGFREVESMGHNDYIAPARYALGYIAYNDGKFSEAYDWFSKSSRDKRFSQTSRYYMLECRFMQKDYEYVEKNGEGLYAEIPDERKPHLARILSEAYLVSGNAEMAKKYYDAGASSGEGDTVKNRGDLFYAGSLKYALGDYQGAVENFSKMEFRNDSIGQIASYQMGYSFIQTKNKVSALSSFAEASSLMYDARIREDAFFNYAKLAFDLNHDNSVFGEYLKAYPNSAKKELIYDYVAVACLFNRDYVGAIEAYDKIDELSAGMKSNYAKANYLRAGQLIAKKSYSDAIPVLKTASFYAPRNDNFGKLTRYWLAESYYRTDNYADAARLYSELYNISALDGLPEGTILAYNVAYSFFMEADYAQAAKWFDIYLSSGNGSVATDAATRRADCDFMRKDYKAAISGYTRVLGMDSDPDHVYPYYRLAVAYGLSGDKSAKATALQPVRKASPDVQMYSDAMFELGRTYVDLKQTDEAVECFKVLEANSRDSIFVARSLIERGMIERNASNVDAALECYKKVVENYLNTGYSEDALLAIEAIYQGRGEVAEYVKYTETIGKPVAHTDSEAENMIFAAAEQIFLTTDYEKAIASLRKYQELYPSGVNVGKSFFYTAESFYGLGEFEKSLEPFRTSLKDGHEASYYGEAVLHYAMALEHLERFDDAYAAFQTLADTAPTDAQKTSGHAGQMRTAYAARRYQAAIDASLLYDTEGRDAGAVYVRAKSCLALSRRDEAFALLKTLSEGPVCAESAEATYMIIQDTYDRGEFDKISDMVFAFSSKAPDQSYWLAKSFIVLGDSYAENGKFKQAKATFESVQSGYRPTSGTSDDVTDTVKMRLEKIEEFL